MEGKEPGIILLNKLQLPEIKTKTLKRRRLLNCIAKNLNKKVILLCAGAGYGKTTLLSHFFSENNIPVAYYHLEKTDAEPVVFFSYLVAGISRLNPRFGSKFERLHHLFNDPQRYLEIIAGTFLNEIIENIREDIYVVLEDYHALHPSGPIDRIIDYIFKHMPANLHFIITSRSKLEVSFLSMLTRDECLEMDIDQLKFTKEEIRRLFEKIYSISLKRKDLEWVEKYSEGWPVSLRLMLQSTNYLEGIRSSDHTRMVISNFLQSQASLFNYFAQEIFFQEKPRVRAFLLDCSVFEWLSPGLCSAVTGRRNTARLLSDLTKRNAFIVRIPEYGYRFHNLFRDFLSSKMTDLGRRRKLYVRAGDYLARRHEYDECLKHYAQANAYRKMARVVQRTGATFIGQGRSAALCKYIEQIPANIRDRDPDLLLIFSQTLTLSGRLEAARLNCLKAYRILKRKPGAKRKHADTLYALGGIYNTIGKRATAMRYYRQAFAVCPRSANLTRAAILNSLGSLHNMLGGRHLMKAITYFSKALVIARKSGFMEIEASILNNWAWSEWKLGNLNDAYAKSSGVVPILQKHFSPGCGAGFYNAARYSILLGYNGKARSILDLGIQTCSPYNDLWSLATIWHGYAAFHLETGDFDKARQFIDKSLQVYGKLGIERLIVAAMIEKCRINIAQHDYTNAEKTVSDIWAHKKARYDAESIPIYLTLAELHMEQDRLRKADDVLQTALQLATRYGEIFQRFLASIELSKLHRLRGDLVKSHTLLREAVQIGKHKGYEYQLLKELEREKWMLHAIREMNIERDYVMGIVKSSKIDIHWIEAYLFGVPKIKIDDESVGDEAWKTIKAKKLLFYLLLRKDARTSGDLLVDKLWPDASASKGSDSLRKAVQHIRGIAKSGLGGRVELLSSAKGAYQISPNISIWLDTDEFDSLSKQALKSSSEDEKAHMLHRAIELYGEGFAIGWYEDWVEDMRLYYRGRYEECLFELAGFHFRKGNYPEAEGLVQKLLALNFLEEHYHRQYMEILGKLGRYQDIKLDFEKFSKMLKKEMKVDPKEDTIILYRSLIGSDTD
jgi:LuxR family maltose regulon positive regulatory protein